MKRGILEYRDFWKRWCLRLVGDIGFAMIGLGGCIGVYERSLSPLLVALAAMIWLLLPKFGRFVGKIGLWTHWRWTALLPAALMCAMVWFSPLTRVWHTLLVLLLASTAQMLWMAIDPVADRPLLPMETTAERLRDGRIYAVGVIVPALVSLLLSRATYEVLLLVAAALFSLTLLADALLFPARDALRETEERPQAANGMEPDVEMASDALNVCGAMTCGALLLPMLLSCSSVHVLASVLCCYFLGLILGAVFNPFQHFYADNREGFCKNSTVILLLLMLFGMARTGWQWNLLALAGGILQAALAVNFSEMYPGGVKSAGKSRAFSRLAGLAIGLALGEAFEFIISRVPVFSEICARLTGQGEGKGYAMVFVLAGFIGAILLHATLRLLRKSDSET